MLYGRYSLFSGLTLSVSPFASPYVCLTLCLSICLFISLSFHTSVYLSVFPYVCLEISRYYMFLQSLLTGAENQSSGFNMQEVQENISIPKECGKVVINLEISTPQFTAIRTHHTERQAPMRALSHLKTKCSLRKSWNVSTKATNVFSSISHLIVRAFTRKMLRNQVKTYFSGILFTTTNDPERENISFSNSAAWRT